MLEIMCAKAKMLEKPYVYIGEDVKKRTSFLDFTSSENLYASQQIFVKIGGGSQVRLEISEDAAFELMSVETGQDTYQIVDKDSREVLISSASLVPLEDPILHSPGQALFNLYKSCSRNCMYCPLPLNKEKTEFMDRSRFLKEIEGLDAAKVKGIGFTSGIPGGWSYEDLIGEMSQIIMALRKKYGQELTISANPPPVGRNLIVKLQEAGLSEIRINIEVFNRDLFTKLCPGYDFEQTCEAIGNAVQIFGKNRVSTNMVIGLGETDEDVCSGIEYFARLGVITILSPLDIVPERINDLQRLSGGGVKRPDWRRLYNLALRQKEIFSKYGVNPLLHLRTMCGRCSSCNITPFVDF